MGNEDTRREILLHSTRLNRDFPVSVYRNETGDFIIMHRSLREVFDSIESGLKPMEMEPVQIQIPANDTSTLWVFRQNLVFNNGDVIWGIGSISKNEMAKRPNLIRDMFRPDIALNRAFDNAVLRWLKFELKVNDKIVRWFYGSDSMDMKGAMPVTDRNLTEVMSGSQPKPFEARNDVPAGGQPGFSAGIPVNYQGQAPQPVPGQYQPGGNVNTGGMPAPVLPNTAQVQRGYIPSSPAPVPGVPNGDPRMALQQAPPKNPMVRKVYYDHDQKQTRIETDMGSILFSPDTQQWTGETLNPSSVPNIQLLMEDASKLIGSDISNFRGMLGIA